MATELKPLSCVYLARKKDTGELIGWDAVDAFSISKHQKMLGEENIDIFYKSLRGGGWYHWTDGNTKDPFAMGFYELSEELVDRYIPKEVQMKLLTGAL